MRELPPETDSRNRFTPGACSLISNQFYLREQNSRAKVLLRSFVLLRERVAGACCRSVRVVGASSLSRVYQYRVSSIEGCFDREFIRSKPKLVSIDE